MSPVEIEQIFQQMEYVKDARRGPDEPRRRRFHAGWGDAVSRGKIYNQYTLKRLTWNNLGYRLGQNFGAIAASDVDFAYDHLAKLWKRDFESGQLVKNIPVPPVEQYVAALENYGGIADHHKKILILHYGEPERTTTAIRLAKIAGYSRYSTANSQYGRLGRIVGNRLGYSPEPERLSALVTFDKRNGEWHWIMRPQVAQALERLGWVDGDTAQWGKNDTVARQLLIEGTISEQLITVYERNPEARRQCKAAHGTRCSVCHIDFGAIYGPEFAGFIHIHHLHPISEAGGEYTVDPINDLCPVCPNCHAVIHRGGQLRTIAEVRLLLEQNKRMSPIP